LKEDENDEEAAERGKTFNLKIITHKILKIPWARSLAKSLLLQLNSFSCFSPIQKKNSSLRLFISHKSDGLSVFVCLFV